MSIRKINNFLLVLLIWCLASGGVFAAEQRIEVSSGQSYGDITSDTFNGFTNYNGGAIYNNGGTIGAISDSKFTENIGSGVGGAIRNDGTIAEITGSEFTKNTAYTTGGAIYNIGTIVEISGSTFSENKAYNSGGAIYNINGGSIGSIKNSTFSKNTTDYIDGGAIYNTGSIGEISDSTFTENKTTSSGKSGGAIYNTGTITSISGTITKDAATGEISGTSSFTSNESANGGAIYNTGTIGTETNGTVTGGISNTVFEGNTASSNGGAIYNDSTGKIGEITGNLFTENKTTSTSSSGVANGYGVAIYNDGTITVISSNTFSENSHGEGTIYNGGSGTISIISGNTFTKNSVSDGGGIYNNANIGEISDNTFTENTASNDGGAIENLYGTINKISDCTFTGNKATGTYAGGGAIYNGGTISSIEGTSFDYNSATGAYSYGGAIDNYGTISKISGTSFTNNSAAYGGAIDNYNTIVEISGCTFEKNSATYYGGVIFNSSDETTATINKISGSSFISNTATNGGAICNMSSGAIESIEGTTFDSNQATSGSGGAIYNSGTITTIKNTSFTNNTASGNGGAIYSTTDLTIVADGSEEGGDVVFKGNSASKGDAIYMAADSSGTAGTISFELYNDGSIYLYDSVSGAEGYGVEISGDGTFYLLSELDGAALSIGNTASPYSSDTEALILNTVDGSIVANSVYSLTITSDVSMFVDVDLAKQTMDRFETTATDDNYTVTDGCTLTVSGMNLISDAKSESIAIYFAEPGLMEYVSASTGDLPDGSQLTAYTPRYLYNVYYVYKDDDGVHYGDEEDPYDISESTVFSEDDENGGYFVFRNVSSNPSVYAASVAQAGAFGAMNLMFNYSFEHSDYFMKLPSDVRNAQREKSKSKVKNSENDPTRPAYYNRHMLTQRGAWIRPFVANDLVAYRGNFQSRDKYYGALIGFDSDLHEHRSGWASVLTGFTGYEGIRQSFDGGNIKQRGAVIGLTESAYKKNFYTAVTAAFSTTKAEGLTMWGKEDTRFNTFGAAAKVGYNFELGDGSVSLLPTFTASYTRVGMNTYTSSGGIRMSSEGVYALQLNPNLKFIINRKDGLQPYFTVGEVWTVGQTSDVRADGDKLDELELRPYLEYGFGIQKRWVNALDAYMQILGHAGGREGVVINAGLRWNF